MQSLTLIIFMVSEKIAVLKFLPHTDNWPASQSGTDHSIDSHFHVIQKSKGNAALAHMSHLHLSFSPEHAKSSAENEIFCML